MELEEFATRLAELSARVPAIAGKCRNEEQTKWSLVFPLLTTLGYDVTDPDEVIAEYPSSTPGMREKGRVDIVVARDGIPQFIIETKSADKCIAANEQYHSQTRDYFINEKNILHAILANGVTYRFYTDLDRDNIMDDEPYWVIDLGGGLSDDDIGFLYGFSKDLFDGAAIREGAKQRRKFRCLLSDIKDMAATDPVAYAHLISSIPGMPDHVSPVPQPVGDATAASNKRSQCAHDFRPGVIYDSVGGTPVPFSIRCTGEKTRFIVMAGSHMASDEHTVYGNYDRGTVHGTTDKSYARYQDAHSMLKPHATPKDGEYVFNEDVEIDVGMTTLVAALTGQSGNGWDKVTKRR